MVHGYFNHRNSSQLPKSVGQRNPDEADIQAAQRESQFTEAKEPLVHSLRVKYCPFFTAINVL